MAMACMAETVSSAFNIAQRRMMYDVHVYRGWWMNENVYGCAYTVWAQDCKRCVRGNINISHITHRHTKKRRKKFLFFPELLWKKSKNEMSEWIERRDRWESRGSVPVVYVCKQMMMAYCIFFSLIFDLTDVMWGASWDSYFVHIFFCSSFFFFCIVFRVEI